MNKNTLQILIISVAVIITSAFIFWLIKKNKYKIEEGELTGQDVIGIMETWDSKSDEVIKTLHPKIRDQASRFVNELDTLGIKYRLYSGTRTFEEQSTLYGKGRTIQELLSAKVDPKYSKPAEKRVTNAKPGSSFHNYGLAFDGVEIKNGVAIWTNPKQNIITATGRKYGFFWGGDFVTLKDTPHFEEQKYGTISDLLALYNSGNKDESGYLIV